MNEPNVTDWLEVIVNTIIALGTIATLLFAIKSSKDTAKFSRETLEEAQLNRREDAKPVLQFKKRQFGDNRTTTVILQNAGQGPLFSLRSISPNGINVSTDADENGTIIYYVTANKEIIFSDKAGVETVTYEYKDMYEQTYVPRQELYNDERGFSFSTEVSIPVKQIEKL